MDKKVFNLYIPIDLKEKLEEEAKSKGLSLNSYITMILMERDK